MDHVVQLRHLAVGVGDDRKTDDRPLRLLDVLDPAAMAVGRVDRKRERLDAAPECVGMFCVYGIVECELGEYAGMNHYLLREDDPDCFYRPQLNEPADAIVNFPPPLKNGPQLFTAMSSARAEWFAPWQSTRTARRDADYALLKQRITANVMAMVEQRLPGLRGKLRVIEASTPLTIRDYVGYPGGGLYGLEPSLLSQGRNGVRRRQRANRQSAGAPPRLPA